MIKYGIYIHINDILFSLENSSTCSNMNGSWRHMLSEVKKKNTIWFHLHEVLKADRFTDTESRMVFGRAVTELLFNG